MSKEQAGLPVSVTRARQLLAVLVAVGAVITGLIVVLQDQLIRSWAEGRPDMRRVLRTQGLEAVKNGEVHVPAFMPVAVVMFVVVALLIWVLAAFLRGGYNWARVALTLTLFFLAVGTIGGLRTGAPSVCAS
jgi:cytochrome bd-type quinol oxidase subunit 2